MIKLAVVGDIGSGKSYVAKLFGYPVFSADKEVSKIYNKNKTIYYKLKKKLPNYISSFPIKKIELTRAIISKQKNLKTIIKIVHPKVRQKMNDFIKKNRKKKIVVLDIPLLIENKINRKKDLLIFVDAKKKEINKRLKKRTNYNYKIINKLRKFQLSLEVKKRKSNYIIKNNFKNKFVKKNVKIILDKIILDARSYT